MERTGPDDSPARPRARLALPRRWPEACLLLAIAVAAVLLYWLGGRLGARHEELSVYPRPAGMRVVAADGSIETGCAAADAGAAVASAARPHWRLCAGGRAYPIMITSYAAGYVYWPADALRFAHGDDVFRMRTLGIGLAALTLVLTFALVAWLGDRETAALSVLIAAVSSPFLYGHAQLVHFEALPWPLLVGALLCLRRSRVFDGDDAGAVRTGWVLAAAALAGLSVAANVKAVVLMAGVVLAAAAARVSWRGLGRGRAAAAVAVGLVPLVPAIAFLSVDADARAAGQVAQRGGAIVERLTSADTLLEPLNQLRYWSDVGSYYVEATGVDYRVNPAGMAVAGAALVFCLWAAARSFRDPARASVAAGAGWLLAAFLPFAALFYDQKPAANYAPLHAVFGIATAAFAVEVGRRWWRPATALIAAAAVAAFAWSTIARARQVDALPGVVNARVQRALVAHLREDAGGTVVNTSYALAGVLESLSGGEVTPLEAHPYFDACEDSSRACLVDRWDRLLAPDLLPLRAVIPAHRAQTDAPYIDDLAETLESAARAHGLDVEPDAAFTNGSGTEVLRIYRVTANGS